MITRKLRDMRRQLFALAATAVLAFAAVENEDQALRELEKTADELSAALQQDGASTPLSIETYEAYVNE